MLREGGMPGPRMPRPLQGARMLLTEHRMLERYRRRYGDVFAVDVWPFEPLVVVADPAEVRRIFTGDPAQLHAGEGNGVLEPLVGPHSVLVLDEREHLATRKQMLPPFHGERMRVYGDVMRELADAEIDSWPVGEELPMLPAMQRVTLRIILRTVFGLEEGARMHELETRADDRHPAGDADHARAEPAARPRAAQPGRPLRERARSGSTRCCWRRSPAAAPRASAVTTCSRC